MTKPLTVESYFPEALFLDGKQQLGARICTEDCAVIDASNQYRILASRGEGLIPDTDFRQAITMSCDEEAALTRVLRSEKHIFLTVNQRPLLIFTDWLIEAGLILAILPACEPSAAQTALASLGRDDFLDLSAQESKKSSATACREAFKILSDILSYTDAMLVPFIRQTADALLVARIAEFAGCRLDSQTVFDLSRINSPIRSPISAAFLFCTFLTLRQSEGNLTANSQSPSHICYRITVQAEDYKRDASSVPAPLFSSAACFKDCEYHADHSAATLVFSERTDADLFSSFDLESIVQFALRIERLHIPA